MQAQIDAEAEKRKGFTVTVEGEPIHLPLAYGNQKLGGVRTFHNTTDNYTIDVVDDGFARFQSGLSEAANTSPTASTEKYLWVQQAFCFGGIEEIVDVEVDGLNWNDDKFRHIIDISLNGGVVHQSFESGEFPETNKFTNITYMTGLFSLNRDDPNYMGIPDVQIYARGLKIHSITETAGVYTLSATKTFSNNPAYVLLDYLIREKKLGGCGYAVGDIDLESFYRAAQICNTIVKVGVDVRGRINGVRPTFETSTISTRDVKLYEANITLDTSETRRDNLERILETMSQSELVWSEGKYKLVLQYPSSQATQDALVTATYTDDDIVNGDFNITWAGVADKFNRATVKFLNEEQDYVTDSVSFPEYGSLQHQTYLDQDNTIENEIEYFVQGGTHRVTALAKAEELVRNSRISKVIEFELSRDALVHEQGDLIKVNSVDAGIDNETYRIEEIKITSNLTVQVKCVRFDYTTLAFNVDDDYITNPKTQLPSGVPNVTSLVWNSGTRVGTLSNGYLSWTNPDDDTIRRYLVYYRPVGGEYVPIGETRTNFFDVPAELNDGTTDYLFLVRTEATNGRLSDGAVILLDNLSALTPLDGLVQKAVGVDSVNLAWTYPATEIAQRYEVYQNTANTRIGATRVASTQNDSVVIGPLPVANYWFWVDVVGVDGTVASMTTPVDVSALDLGVGDIGAIADLEEYLTSSLVFQATANTANSAVAELELATYSNGTIDASTARISADAILLDGTVTANKMNVAELSAISATLGTFQSAATGERVVIQDDKIAVYDANNTIRVLIGDLS